MAWQYINKIDAMGGAVEAIEQGYMQDEIARSSYKYQRDIQSGEKIIVGVNKYQIEEKPMDNLFTVDDAIRVQQIEKIKQLKSERNNEQVTQLLGQLDETAKNGNNLMPVILNCCEQYATLGEIADTLRNVFGEHKA
jgi:methylmalonyl-CoA mutase N-terminal domain/subunit